MTACSMKSMGTPSFLIALFAILFDQCGVQSLRAPSQGWSTTVRLHIACAQLAWWHARSWLGGMQGERAAGACGAYHRWILVCRTLGTYHPLWQNALAPSHAICTAIAFGIRQDGASLGTGWGVGGAALDGTERNEIEACRCIMRSEHVDAE